MAETIVVSTAVFAFVAIVLIGLVGLVFLVINIVRSDDRELPTRRSDSSFEEFVRELQAAKAEGKLATFIDEYKGWVTWNCVVIDVLDSDRTYRIAPSMDTPGEYQAMARFAEDADFRTFKKGSVVTLEGVFETVTSAIILHNCRLTPGSARPNWHPW